MGWNGRITFSLSHNIPSQINNAWKTMGIHTGSGGGGGGRNQYSYSVSFFDDDWIGLASELTMQYIKNPNIQPVFEYGNDRI